MNRSDLINAVYAQTNVSKAQTREALEAIIEAITRAMTTGETVQLTGFGSFSTTAHIERTGRNPRTGEEIRTPASKTVRFTADEAF